MKAFLAPTTNLRRRLSSLALAGLAALVLSAPVAAQDLETFDPDQTYDAQATPSAATGVDGDLAAPDAQSAPATDPDVDSAFTEYADAPADAAAPTVEAAAAPEAMPANQAGTYGEDDLIGAAEGVFGKGAEGLAKLIQDLLKEQGEPNGYIVGREASGAFIVGARYGSGTLHHKVEGQQKVYWTGPSIGFDAGANAGNTFVLVYNLYDSEDLYKRFPAGEGQAYFVGGLTASYLRRGDIVLIPIRVGAGLRLGVNAGYMKFSKKQRWLPF